MKVKKYRNFVGDFETTVFEGQEFTEVWASAIVELFTEDVKIFNSINETFDYLFELAKTDNIVISFHNLKFDGAFILDYLIRVLKWEQAIIQKSDDKLDLEWLKDNMMKNKTFKYSISDMGQWYTIIIKVNNHYIEIRDSLKLLPFSVKQIGKSFETKHKKLDMEYVGFRYAGCEITDEEKEYIKNDVLVVKEALEIMSTQGHNKLTIGSCCLSEYKSIISEKMFQKFYPDLTKITIDKNEYGSSNADEYVRKSYKGGWCYLVKGKENNIYTNGFTIDVNSLYPSVMSCGYYYPIGEPTFWKGNYIPNEALKPLRYYFIRVKTRFRIKNGYLPFLQIKGSLLYNSTECLMSSDVYNPKHKRYYKYIEDNGEYYRPTPILTFTMTDWKLFQEHYDLFDCEILDGCWFYANNGLFDEYIEKYKQIKVTSKGAIRNLAKLYLNNLYGKLATSDDSSFKYAYLKEDDTIGFVTVIQHEKRTVFVPCGSAITSYAREFTIRTAQKNYYGANSKGFIYADTDSIHCDLPIDKLKGVEFSDTEFCKWKLESEWDEAIFIRQKTYMEHIVKEDGKEVNEPYYNIKCAGMPEKCKQLFLKSMTQDYNSNEYSEEELEFLKEERNINDFKRGLKIPSKLLPKRIKGGIVLVNTTYEIR